MPATESKRQIGVRGEDLACAELERQGLQVLERNWRCRLGEIDIVAAEAGPTGLTLVFCEVKCRSGLGFGHPLEAITYAKMRTLRQLAAVWMRAPGLGLELGSRLVFALLLLVAIRPWVKP